jgi:PAS domain S-box-containing protein
MSKAGNNDVAMAPGLSSPLSESLSSHPSVLLVDVQSARLLSYEAVLSSLNVRCVRVRSGREALACLVKQPFAAIILDPKMPGMDGCELARMMREHPGLERTPIIFVTEGNLTEVNRLEGYEVGTIDYISIPVVPEILRGKMAILVELHQRRHELQMLNQALQEAHERLHTAHLRAMADARAQLQERLLLAKKAARLGIYDWDIQTGALQWDERTRELWGVKPGEPVSYDVFTAALHPDDREQVQATVDKSLAPNSDGQYSATFRVINLLDGVTRWIEAVGRVSCERGIAVRLVGTVQDITVRKRAEEILRAAGRRKDEFIAMLAHELRNPVAPIRNAAEVLAHLIPDEPKQQALVSMIQRQAGQLARVLDELLDATRLRE